MAKNIKAVLADPPEKTKPQYLRTGSTLLDLCIGGGVGLGIPAGVVVNLVGDKSSGKTFLANEIIAATHWELNQQKKDRFVWNFDDCESGHTFDTVGLYGVAIRPEKPEDKEIPDSTTIEEMDTNVGVFLRGIKPGQVGLYVVDSLDGLSDDEKEDRATERVDAAMKGKTIEQGGTYGVAAPKFLSQEFFKTKTAQFREKNSTLIIVSQVRENMERRAFGKKYKRAGGKALDFYAHTCLWLSTIRKIERAGRVVGVYVEAVAEKSKTPRPFRSVRFSLYFAYGIDDIGSNLDYLYDLRTESGELNKDAESICWDGTEPKNLETLRAWLERENLLETARADRKAEAGRANLSKEFILEWVDRDPERRARLDAHFGISESREALIERIGRDRALQNELERRVIAKWEAAEAAAVVARPSKYGSA